MRRAVSSLQNYIRSDLTHRSGNGYWRNVRRVLEYRSLGLAIAQIELEVLPDRFMPDYLAILPCVHGRHSGIFSSMRRNFPAVVARPSSLRVRWEPIQIAACQIAITMMTV